MPQQRNNSHSLKRIFQFKIQKLGTERAYITSFNRKNLKINMLDLHPFQIKVLMIQNTKTTGLGLIENVMSKTSKSSTMLGKSSNHTPCRHLELNLATKPKHPRSVSGLHNFADIESGWS